MVLIRNMTKEINLPTIAGLICVGLLTWNVTTTQALAVEIAGFKADVAARVARLEYLTERLENRLHQEKENNQ